MKGACVLTRGCLRRKQEPRWIFERDVKRNARSKEGFEDAFSLFGDKT